jgi:hypothetical protein
VVTVLRKPPGASVSECVLQHHTGGLHIDATRVGCEGGIKRDGRATLPNASGWANMKGHGIASLDSGRWPANLIHGGSEEVVGLFPDAGNGWKRNYGEEDYAGRQYGGGAFGGGGYKGGSTYCDSGSAARFFYCIKDIT